MEKENITGLLLKAIDLFSSLYSLLPRIEGGSYDLGPDEAIEEEWEEVGPGLDSIIGDDENLVKLIEYLKAERNAGHSIDPQIQELREWLWRAVTLVPGVNKATITGLTNHSDKYCNWLDWINRYYPPEQSKQGPGQKSDFNSCLLVQEDKQDELLKKLHELIDGKVGKAVALVIGLCVELGLMTKPTFGVLKAEFGNIGNASGFNSYYGKYETSYTKEEKDGLKKHFEPFLKCI